MTRFRPLLLAFAVLCAPPALADEDDGPVRFEFGGDVYAAGDEPALSGASGGAVFAAGNRVRLEAGSGGSAHLAGRRVSVAGPVGGDLYAAGYEIDVTAEIAGDATIGGYDVRVEAPVGGVLRAMGDEVRVSAPAGAILVVADRFALDAPVAGDVRVTAGSVEFGPNASVGGVLTLSTPRDEAPPDAVAPAERVQRTGDAEGLEGPGVVAIVLGGLAALLGTALALLAAQALFLGAAPRWSEDIAFDVAERPFRSLGAGFLAAAALIGAIPLLFATLIGAPVAIALMAAVPLALLAGYALGAWSLGAAIWRAMDRPAPFGFWMRLAIGALGLVAAALAGVIPFLGWLVSVAVTLVGLGAAAARFAAGRAG